ncbi:MAG: sulfur carrier protein ThiS [Planctomycetes bacterium]|nr:sulfur carrier protein ThiS [Planctomycetota bacterium]
MRITVNGEPRDVPDGHMLAALVAAMRLPPQPTAIEVNRELVPRSQHAARRLAEGDAVEIVTLVGGG